MRDVDGFARHDRIMTMIGSRQVAETYFASVRARDADGLGALFAEDGVLVLPDGRELVGPQAIAGLYRGMFASAPPTPRPFAFVEAGLECAVELEARFDDGRVTRACDLFRLQEDGLIRRLDIYARR
jgi:ketosteroid isomerase-like protein